MERERGRDKVKIAKESEKEIGIEGRRRDGCAEERQEDRTSEVKSDRDTVQHRTEKTERKMQEEQNILQCQHANTNHRLVIYHFGTMLAYACAFCACMHVFDRSCMSVYSISVCFCVHAFECAV